MAEAAVYRLPADGLDRLRAALDEAGYDVWGPAVRAGTIVLERLRDTADLPCGQRSEQEAGRYRLRDGGDGRRFAAVHGADSWKRLLHPPQVRLWRACRDEAGRLTFADEPEPPAKPYAFFGVRGCDLAAIRRLDGVFTRTVARDPVYPDRRADLFLVAVDCAEPADTCFCASMGTGPQVDAGFDWRLTELCDDGGHRFLVTAGSARGVDLLAKLTLEPADQADHDARTRQGEAAVMGRALDVDGLASALVARRESSHFENVAERCLGCANCTMVCPTCFCTTVADSSDLAGTTAERHRLWDSCFTLDFSYVNGGTVREGGAARYRQWLLHKLATWWDQFDACGCVGCGRCIAWCPVGIDITAEAAALRREPAP